jgi:hypothetical protein
LHDGHRRYEDTDEHRDGADQRNLADMVLATAGLVREAKTKREGTHKPAGRTGTPSAEVYAVVPQFKSDDKVTFLSHCLGALASV